MIEKYNRQSFYWGIPGIILQIIGIYLFIKGERNVFGLLGTILLLVGIGYYAKGKGRHWAWCFLAFLGIIGVIVLNFLRDYSTITPSTKMVVSARRTYRFWLIFYLCTSVPFGLLLIISMLTTLRRHSPYPSPFFGYIFIFFLLVVLPTLILINWKRKSRILSAELEQQRKENEKNTHTGEDITDNGVEHQEKCTNCGRVIGKLEQPWIFRNSIVCAECWKKLENS